MYKLIVVFIVSLMLEIVTYRYERVIAVTAEKLR